MLILTMYECHKRHGNTAFLVKTAMLFIESKYLAYRMRHFTIILLFRDAFLTNGGLCRMSTADRGSVPPQSAESE